MESKIIVSAIALCLFSAVAVNALRCYGCTDTNDGPCFDPEGQNVSSIVCDQVQGPGDYVCYKLIYTSNDNELVLRGCQKEAGFDAFCETNSRYEGVQCLSCTEDLCNSSNKVGVISFTVLALCLFLAKLF